MNIAARTSAVALAVALTSGCRACGPAATVDGPEASALASPPTGHRGTNADDAAASAADAGDAPVVVGGPCDYTEQSGTCTTKPGDTFTFRGKIDGAPVTLDDNPLDPSAVGAPATGKSAACTIKFLKTGTCTPCLFSIGSCGPGAWESFRRHAAR